MSGKKSTMIPMVLATTGGAGLFTLSWLVLGLPLYLGLLIGAGAYVALWLMARGLGRGKEESGPAIGDFVDIELARSTVAGARTLAAELQGLVDQLPARHDLYRGFSRLPALAKAIADDVEDDPKDAPQAKAFIAYQGEAAVRLLRLVLDIRRRSGQDSIEEQTSERLASALARLETSFREHLTHLQEDNLAELQAELELLEQGLSLDEQLSGNAAAARGNPGGRRDDAAEVRRSTGQPG